MGLPLTADRAKDRVEARSVGALAAHTVLECVRERQVQPVELQHVRVRVRVRVRWLQASYRRALLWLQACSTLKPSTLTAWPTSGPRSPCAE